MLIHVGCLFLYGCLLSGLVVIELGAYTLLSMGAYYPGPG